MVTGEIKKVTINFANKNLHLLDVTQIQQAERWIQSWMDSKLVQSKFNEKYENEGARI